MKGCKGIAKHVGMWSISGTVQADHGAVPKDIRQRWTVVLGMEVTAALRILLLYEDYGEGCCHCGADESIYPEESSVGQSVLDMVPLYLSEGRRQRG